MKFVRLVIIAVAITGMGFLAFDLTRPEYPVLKTLENSKGKTIEALIQGKEGNSIIFDRMPDRNRFEIEVDSLSWKDRLYSLRLKDLPAPEKKVEAGYVQTRLAAIEDLKVKEQVIIDELNSRTLNDLLHQNRMDQLTALQKEIRTLEVAIKTYNYRMNE